MTVPTFLTGAIAGMLLTLAIITIIDKIEQAREEEARERYEARQRQLRLRQKMNEPREPMSQKIMEEARKGLQRREEG